MRQLRVVLIEDDAALNDGLALSLAKSGYIVHSFLTTEEFEMALLQPADIYLLDKQLPGIDGVELCKRLKSHTLTSGIPVIIMSASPDAAYYTKQAGGDAFLEKPFTRKQLLEIMLQLLNKGS